MAKKTVQTEFLLTKEGVSKLKKELEYLVGTRRPEIIDQLVEARSQGDLSENADYDSARNAQGALESRIKEIDHILGRVKIINEETTKRTAIRLGVKVEIQDMSDESIEVYEIVGPLEANPFDNMISNESPLAKTIMGRKVGETVEIKGIENPYKVKIIAIK